jgi:hypothetical protein
MPKPWYGLFDEADLNAPVLVAYSQSRQELRDLARQEARDWTIEVLDHDPRQRVTVTPTFAPDVQACLKALRGLEELLK